MSFPIVGADAPLDDIDLPAFVVARDGLYLRKRSLLGLSQTKVERIAHLPEASEFIEHALPRLPSELLGRTLGFFKAVYRERKSEAIVLLLWGPAGFALAVPAQKVSGWSLEFSVDDGDVLDGHRVVGTIHSHGALSAGASVIDEADEAKLDGLHLVVGDLDRRHPSVSAAIAIDGRRFDVPPRAIAQRIGRSIDPPADWLARVSELSTPRASKRSLLMDRFAWTERPRPSGPNRRELERALDRVEALASSLGYRLSYQLLPAVKSGKGGSRGDA